MRCAGDGSASAVQPAHLSALLPTSDSSRLHPVILGHFHPGPMGNFSRLNRKAMFFHRCQIPAMLIACFFVRAIHSIQKCGRVICRDDQICCVHGNDTTEATCCKRFVDKTYYNIAMVTRKLSGVLILLLLFAVGYFVHRALCSRSRQLTPASNGQPAATTSQEPLVESCTPDSFTAPAPAAHLPTYEECKRLPTYEETVREGSSGQQSSSSSSMGQAT